MRHPIRTSDFPTGEVFIRAVRSSLSKDARTPRLIRPHSIAWVDPMAFDEKARGAVVTVGLWGGELCMVKVDDLQRVFPQAQIVGEPL